MRLRREDDLESQDNTGSAQPRTEITEEDFDDPKTLLTELLIHQLGLERDKCSELVNIVEDVEADNSSHTLHLVVDGVDENGEPEIKMISNIELDVMTNVPFDSPEYKGRYVSFYHGYAYGAYQTLTLMSALVKAQKDAIKERTINVGASSDDTGE